MIFYACVKGSFWPLAYRWLLIMKLTVFITLLSVMQVVASGFAQTITLKAKNIPLSHVMRVIQKQSGHPFFLNGKDLAEKKVEADFKNVPLNKAMADLLKPLALE